MQVQIKQVNAYHASITHTNSLSIIFSSEWGSTLSTFVTEYVSTVSAVMLDRESHGSKKSGIYSSHKHSQEATKINYSQNLVHSIYPAIEGTKIWSTTCTLWYSFIRDLLQGAKIQLSEKGPTPQNLQHISISYWTAKTTPLPPPPSPERFPPKRLGLW